MSLRGVLEACWDAWEHGAHAQLSVCPGEQLQWQREPPALCRVTLGPGAAVVHGVGALLGLGSSGCGDSSPGGGVQAGWGWVTVISCPQAAAVVSCRCRGEGAGEQAGLPGGCWAPPGAGIVAAVCCFPRVSAGQGWGGCSRGDAGRFLGDSLLRVHGDVGEWAVHQCWMSLLSRDARGTQESPKLSDQSSSAARPLLSRAGHGLG